MDSDDDSYYSANSSVHDDSFSSMTPTLGDCVRQNFNHNSQNLLKVCHINAQSIPSHYSDLLETFTDCDVHAILISESWLKPQLLSTAYPLTNFVLIRNDRAERRGGGVAIYLRNNFSYKILFASSVPSSAEFLFLEISTKGAKAVLGVVYCPPNVDYFSSFDSILESLGSEYSHHIIMGDFNTDLLSSQSPRSQKLLEVIESANLHIVPLHATHHNRDGNDTWLDLILTSNPSLIYSQGQFPAPGFSHHDLIFLSYVLKPPKPKPKCLYMRCFSRINLTDLQSDASKVNWDHIEASSSIDQKVQYFGEVVHQLYDIHAPVRKVKLKRPPAPWISEDIRTAMKRRDRAYRKYRRNRCHEHWSGYKFTRNRCNQMIRNAKRRYILNNISLSSAANTWKFLGTLGIGKHCQPDLQMPIGLDDINQHFASTIPLNHNTKCRTVDYLNHLPQSNIYPFHFSPVAIEEIKKIILSIKSNAVGCDYVSRRMILLILDHLLPAISHIINFSLESGHFPSLWRKAYVIPLPKISNPSLPNHFRPISILPFLSKVLEACVHKQLSDFISSNDLLSQFQSGFRPGHSTTTALLKVTGDIRAGMEKTNVTVLALIDFSNAFNTVSHDILLAILSHILISSNALKWFSSYLQGRQQCVRIEDSLSNWCDLNAGVPQGGILSPLLFSIFINLITNYLQCSYHLYADDLQLYCQATVDTIPSAIAKINRDMENIKSWCDQFGLTVNPTKCQAIIVGSQRMMGRVDVKSLPSIFYNGSIVPLSSVVKDLGLYIDSTLNWRTQVARTSQRVTSSLRTLNRLRHFLPVRTKTMLVQTLIFPLIDYGDVCYFDLNADLLNKLDRLLNNCIRFIYNLRKYDHVSTYRSQLNFLTIRQRRSMRALNLLFSILKSPNSPDYLSSFFQYLSTNHDRNLRSSNNLLLLCPSHSSQCVHSSFLVQVVLLWNSLPLDIRMSTSRHIFKKRVRGYLLNELAESS